jgi:protocatechuate 3,4-dioxygenase beta subunit
MAILIPAASRRRFLALSTAGVLSIPARGLAETLPRTPGDALGPFYPIATPFPKTHDLTRPPSGGGRARGDLLHVSGRVVDRRGSPVAGARIEIWQANAAGRYAHASDDSAPPLDPNFQGLAVFEADADGRYAFLTIKPGGYPSERGMRTPHIHYQVTGRRDRLVTQVYFPNEPLNASDFLLKNQARPDAVTLRLADPPAADRLNATFNIVLGTG